MSATTVTREIAYKFSASAGNVESVAGRVQKALKGARKSEQSEALEEVTKLFRGAGALGAIELAAIGIQKMATAAGEFAQNMALGKNHWGDLTEKVLGSVPVYGEVWKAGRGIRDAFQDIKASGGIESASRAVLDNIPGGKSLAAHIFGTPEQSVRTQDEIFKGLSDNTRAHLSEIGEGIGKSAQQEANLRNRTLALIGLEGPEQIRATIEEEKQVAQSAVQNLRDEINKVPFAAQVAPEAFRAANMLSDIANKEAKLKSVAFEKVYYRERAKVVADGEAKIRELKVANSATLERYAGHDLNARLLDIKIERDARMRAIKDEFDEKLRAETDPARRQKLFEQRGSEAIQNERTRRINEDVAREEDRKSQNEKRFAAAARGVEFLQKEAELGDKTADIAAKKLQIITDYAQKQQEISDLLAKENLPKNQQDLLRGVLAGLPDQQAKALALVGVGQDKFSGGLAPSDESYHLTGLAASARENDPANQIAKSTINIEKYTKLTSELLSKQVAPAFTVK